MSTERLAAALDLDVYEIGICHACLSFVSFPLDAGAEAAIADIERLGPRAPIVSAVIRRLAADLTRRTRQELEREGLLRPPAPVLELPDRIDRRASL